MKTLSTLLVLLVIASQCFSQQPYTRSFDIKNYTGYFGVSPDGGAIICGSAYSFGISTSSMIKVNSSGNILFAKEFSGQSFTFKALGLANGSSLIGMSQYPYDTCKLMMVDSNGTVMWCKGYYSNGIEMVINRMLFTNHNTFLIAGGSNYFEIDLTGNLLWSRQFGGTGYYMDFTSLKETPSGYLLSRLYDDGEVFNFEIIKTDFTGAIIWVNNQYLHGSIEYAIYHAEVAEIRGAIYACMSIDGWDDNQQEGLGGVLQKFDLNGNFISSKGFSVPGGPFGTIGSVFDCKYAGDGQFMVSLLAHNDYPEPADAYVFAIDTSGIIQWSRVYADSAITQIESDSNHNIYCLLNERYYSSTYNIPFVLSMITSNGESPCDVEEKPVTVQENGFSFSNDESPWLPDTLHLSIKDVEIGLEYFTVVVTDECINSGIGEAGTTEIPGIFPNPADKFFELTIPSDFKMIKYEVFDLSGRIIFQSEQLPHTNANVYSIDLRSYIGGMYTVRITCSNRIFTGKFMVHH
jgi:hypothetical protein